MEARPSKRGGRHPGRVYATGEKHARWLGGVREKVCPVCRKTFRHIPPSTYATFRKQRFCSFVCGVRGRKERYGPDHHNWRENARRKNRGGPHKRWRDAVIARDNGMCQRCGILGVEIHAHHIKPYKDFPALRFDLDNGVALCFRCHWAEHTALTAKTVKSGDTPPEQSEGNPEPSKSGDILEGVTTRGRVFRRWIGPCAFCGTTISRSLSDIVGKAAIYCGKVCMGKGGYRKHGPIRERKTVTPSTSAVPERDDIV